MTGDDTLDRAFRDGAQEGFRTLFETDVTEQASPPVPVKAAGAVTALITFSGPVAGAVEFTCPAVTARRMAQCLLGDEAARRPSLVYDGVGEFLNIIIGYAKTNYGAERELVFGTPLVEADMTPPPGSYSRSTSFYFGYDGETVVLTVRVK